MLFIWIHGIIYRLCMRSDIYTYKATKEGLRLAINFMALPDHLKDYLLNLSLYRKELAAIIILLGSLRPNRFIRLVYMILAYLISLIFSYFYKTSAPVVLLGFISFYIGFLAFLFWFIIIRPTLVFLGIFLFCYFKFFFIKSVQFLVFLRGAPKRYYKKLTKKLTFLPTIRALRRFRLKALMRIGSAWHTLLLGLSTFRFYLVSYLRSHLFIHKFIFNRYVLLLFIKIIGWLRHTLKSIYRRLLEGSLGYKLSKRYSLLFSSISGACKTLFKFLKGQWSTLNERRIKPLKEFLEYFSMVTFLFMNKRGLLKQSLLGLYKGSNLYTPLVLLYLFFLIVLLLIIYLIIF